MCIVLYLDLCMVSCGINKREEKNDIFDSQYQIVKDNLYGEAGEDIKENCSHILYNQKILLGLMRKKQSIFTWIS